jgi:hypothetical protein
MRNLSLFLAIISMAFLSSCTNKVEKSWEETLRVHDEVMLIMQENGEVEKKLDVLIKRGNESENSVLHSKVDTLQGALDNLSAADEAMMDWMATLKKPQKGEDPNTVLAYHKELQESIVKIGNDMMVAAQKAEDIIKSLEK